MALCWPSLIIFVYAFSTFVVAANFTLSTELTNFIPSCAQECFLSFIDENFPTGTCSTTPTLDCLCSHNSTTGYTIGEGALQCIISEDNIGFCQGDDAKDSVATRAFEMCSGQPSALPNTHGTITATLILETTQPSILLVPTSTTTTTTSISKSLTTTRTNTVHTSSSISSSSSTSATGILTESGTPIPRTTAATSTTPLAASSTSARPAATTSPASSLSTPQIAGIAVASAGGLSLAIGGLLLFMCWSRRKQRREKEDDELPFQMDPSNPMMGTMERRYHPQESKSNIRGPGGTSNGLAAKVAPPIPPRLDTPSPNMFSRRSIYPERGERPEVIGLAISRTPGTPDIRTERQQRRASKLLPEKPLLKVQVPQGGEQSSSFSSAQRPTVPDQSAMSRQSTVTLFEDEEESALSGINGRESWRRMSNAQNPASATANLMTIRHVNSNGAPQPISVSGADSYSWRPPQSSIAINQNQQDYVRPLNLGRGPVRSFSQPRRPDIYPQPQQEQLQQYQQPPPQLQLSVPTGSSRPITTSSSIYSRSSNLNSDMGRISGPPRPRRSYRHSGPYDHKSSNSIDTLESATSPQEPRTADLSPVVESPASGRSPVSYPKIPGRLSDLTRKPPPPQPDFVKAMGKEVPPWRQAEIDAQRVRMGGQIQGDIFAEVGMQHARGHQRKRSRDIDTTTTNPSSFAPQNQDYSVSRPLYQQQERNVPLTDATGGWGLSSSLSQSQLQSSYRQNPEVQQQSQLQRQAQSQPRSSSPPKPLSSHPSITFTRSSSTLSQHSTSSSLLAKRRGSEKAATLTLLKDRNEEDKKRQLAKWRVLKREEIEEAKKVGWRPMAGRGSVDGGREGDISGLGDWGEREFERTELPVTPGWVPKLTPTRRGDELFLSVA